MKITEEVLKELGFAQQNPPYIWDYPVNGKIGYGDDMIRVTKADHHGKEIFQFQYGRAYPVIVGTVMAMVQVVATIARSQGVTETQDKLYAALGFDRLLDRLEERIDRRHD